MGGLFELMPSLRPPDGVEMTGGGSSASGNGAENRSQMVGAPAPEALLGHFSPQLREQGWTVQELVAGERAGVLSAMKAHDDGATLILSVATNSLGGDEQAVSMTITLRR